MNPESRETNHIGREKTRCKANDAVSLGHLILRDLTLMLGFSVQPLTPNDITENQDWCPQIADMKYLAL